MRSIAREKHAAVPHGFDHEAAHSSHAFLQNWAFIQPPVTIVCQPSLKFLPDAILGPFREILIRGALQIQARDLR